MRKPDEYTAEDVRAWLETLPGDNVAGFCRDPQSCVISRFLQAEGYYLPAVQPYGNGHGRAPYIAWYEGQDQQQVRLPDDLRELASSFDDLADDERPISVARALELFDEQ